MKKLLLSVFSGLAFTFGFAQSTATDFTATDCASTSHNLFTELDAGKVVVICWVMPCATCITPAATNASAVQSFASSYPGRVKYYVVDDNGGTSCSTLSSWQSTNGITSTATFGNAGNVIKMTDYGTAGMPKTVVLGGANHTVYYNQNGTVSSSALNTAITNALNATTGIAETENINSFHIFPNPANNSSTVSYSLESSSDVTIDVYNMIGENIKTVFSGNQNAGEHKLDVDCTKLNNGFYFIKIGAGKLEKTILLSVSR